MFRPAAAALAAALALLALSSASATAAGGPALGGPCPEAGQMTGLGPGKSAVCSRVKGKLVWTQLTSPGKPAPGSAPAASGAPGAGGASAPASAAADCNPSTVRFTANLIDPGKVSGVAPIGGQTGSGGVVAVRSYVFPLRSLVGQRVPLYAPVDMTLTGAARYKLPQAPANYEPEFSLEFTVRCGVSLKLYHVKAISDRLATVVPATVTPSSATDSVKPLAVKAGEQIGWWIGGEKSVAFDFWVDNAKVTNAFITPQRYLRSNYLHAVCPYSFYVEPLRRVWLAKLGTQSGLAVPGTPCGTVSQGKAGTMQGQWFLDPNPATGLADVISYDGQYMSQGVINLESDGTVRIGGFWSPGYVLTDKNDATWADPAKVTDAHCWFDRVGNRSVSMKLDSPTKLRVAVVDGPCPASIDAVPAKTYYR